MAIDMVDQLMLLCQSKRPSGCFFGRALFSQTPLSINQFLSLQQMATITLTGKEETKIGREKRGRNEKMN